MKTICFVTATRSEYGLLKWIMREVNASDCLVMQLVVTGAHLLPEQGMTINNILEDGFKPDMIVDADMDVSSVGAIASSMGRMAERFSDVFQELHPDYVAVLGDRYELLPIVNSAFVMGIPIIHFSGGDVTEGAIDDGIRNAITMLATYHFPGTKSSAANIARMIGNRKNIWNVGEPGLDSFNRETLFSREYLANELHIDISYRWGLFTYHAETKKSLEHNLFVVKTCIEYLAKIPKMQIVATYANADYGGEIINEYLEEMAKKFPEVLTVVPSLGNLRYLSFMKQACIVIGNSSSGIVEAPSLGIPVVNIGNRQKGRHLCNNVIQTNPDASSISDAIQKAISYKKNSVYRYWGDGHTAEKVIKILEEELS